MTELNPVDAMTTDYRELCAELVEAYAWCIEEYMTAPAEEDTLIKRARALLAQPVAEGPTDEELWALGSDDFRANYYPTDAIAFARAVLARWGRPTPQPVAVSERLPGPEDCDEQGRCWLWERDCGYNGRKWALVNRDWSLSQSDEDLFVYTHWLPANALPIPITT